MSSTSPSPNSPAIDPVSPSSNSPLPQLPPSSPPPNPPNSPPLDPPSAPPPQPNSPPPRPPGVPPPQVNLPPSKSAATLPPQSNSPPSESATTLPPQSNSPPSRSPPPEPNSPPVVTPPPVMASTPPTPPPSPPASVSPPPSSPPALSPPPPTNPPTSSPPSHSPPRPSPPTSSPPPQPPPQPSLPPASPPPRPPPQSNPPTTSPPPQSPTRLSPPPSSPSPSPPTDPPTSAPPPPPPPSSPPSPPSPPPASPAPPNTAPPPTSEPPESSPSTPSTRPSPNSPSPQNPATPPLNSLPSIPPPSNSSSVQPSPPSNVPVPPGSPPSTILAPPANSGNNNSSNNPPVSSQSSSGGGGGIGTGGTIAIAVTLSVLLLGVFGIAACCVWKRKKKVSRHDTGFILPTSVGSSPKSDSGLLKLQISGHNSGSGSGNVVLSPHEPGGLGNSRSWFTFEELVEATNGFSPQNLLGEGGFGSVYKGHLPDGMEVAVKQLKLGGGQGEREFKSEVEIISRIHHRHLVSLVGYCISDEKRLLVYDYVPNNTLYFHLHGEDRPVMDWDKRVKIAVGAARGIAYLHEDCNPRIIHRDIKSSNILLDNNFEAKVSDFGLAKLAMDANTHVTTRVMGTFGYMAPEYASSGKLTEKSDVYSFGVVLLELITGRKPVDTSQPLGEESIVEWARPLFSHALETHDFNALEDPKLDGNYVDSEMFRLIEAAAACVRHSSSKRPKMSQVVRAFDSIVVSDLSNGMKVGESEIFNSAQQSEEIRFFRRLAFGSQNYSSDFFTQNSSSSESKPDQSLRETS